MKEQKEGCCEKCRKLKLMIDAGIPSTNHKIYSCNDPKCSCHQEEIKHIAKAIKKSEEELREYETKEEKTTTEGWEKEYISLAHKWQQNNKGISFVIQATIIFIRSLLSSERQRMVEKSGNSFLKIMKTRGITQTFARYARCLYGKWCEMFTKQKA